ncbi:uncharacterized protein LOC114264403 [Camellia sinensis]|uniref:uncharacterized protein LOC114264403 n=1 Tax=Camellia sinensis TaxID=4442 RepID=UPI001036A6AE|nr:uncharacterized protein LOC114264403 [Camellia sinensis]
MNPLRYHGGIEPLKAEAWVLEMEKLFEVFPSIDTQKVSLVAFTLDDDARRWWMMIREGNPGLTWARFLELFHDKHFSLSVQDCKTIEFQTLTQLARYAPHTANTECRKAKKFESGLRGLIQDWVNMLNMLTYVEVLDKAILAKANLNRYQSLGDNQRKRQNYDNC